MEEIIGLQQREIRLVKRNDSLVKLIYDKVKEENPQVTMDLIKEMLRYDVWTVRQFSDLTGLAESTIANKCRPLFKNGKYVTELDFTYTHPDFKGDGWKGILRNEKSEKLLPQLTEETA